MKIFKRAENKVFCYELLDAMRLHWAICVSKQQIGTLVLLVLYWMVKNKRRKANITNSLLIFVFLLAATRFKAQECDATKT